MTVQWTMMPESNSALKKWCQSQDADGIVYLDRYIGSLNIISKMGKLFLS